MLTVHGRFQRRLGELLGEAKTRGAKAAKSDLARACRDKAPSWVSNLLSDRSEHPRLELEDLFDIAAFFRVSISELLGAPRKGELSGDEQRMLYAFRALPQPTKDHFLAILETASIGAQATNRTLQPQHRPGDSRSA